MVQVIRGRLDAQGLRFGIVLPRFNEIFGERLLSAAVDCLERHGARNEDLTVVRVPGSFEVTGAVRTLIRSGKMDAIIALGVLIRGATSHYDHIAAEVARGLGQAAAEGKPPVVYGIVTAENQEQAMERCGGKMGNRGWDAALSAVEMANLVRTLVDGPGGEGG